MSVEWICYLRFERRWSELESRRTQGGRDSYQEIVWSGAEQD